MLVSLFLEGGLSSEVIKAIGELITLLVDKFGTERVFWLAVIILICSFIWKLWADGKKDREINIALEEKDRTIQRLASENREYRILIFKKNHSYSDEEIDKFILKNIPENADEARNWLEKSVQSVKKVFASNEESEKNEDIKK